jgi:hypothetical protein
MPAVDPGPVPLGAYRNWPGLDASGHIEIDRTQVRAVASRLTAHLEDMLSADKDLRPADAAAYGNWDAAGQFYPSVQAGHATLMDHHSRFMHAVMDMIKKLHVSAQAYDDAESELERRIAAVDKRLKDLPATNLFQHGTSSPVPKTAAPDSLNPEGRD